MQEHGRACKNTDARARTRTRGNPAQQPVSLAVDELAYILNVDRPMLHIHQAVKGEACGKLTLSGYQFNSKTGLAIPADLSSIEIEQLPKWVLVIEKYAVYERLVTAGYTNNKPCLLVTGRGTKIVYN